MQILKLLTLLAITIAPIVGLRLLWKWARKRSKQFNDRHPRYVRRTTGEPSGSTEEFLFAPMPQGWFSSWGFAVALAVAGALVILLDELAHR